MDEDGHSMDVEDEDFVLAHCLSKMFVEQGKKWEREALVDATSGKRILIKDLHDPAKLELLRNCRIIQKEVVIHYCLRLIKKSLETIDEKISFKNLIKNYRCLVVADGYYEWKREKKNKQPYYLKCEKHLFYPPPFTQSKGCLSSS